MAQEGKGRSPRVASSEVGPAHSDAYDEAIDRHLEAASRVGLGPGEYEVRLMARVKVKNPGSIDQYWVEFVQRTGP